MILTQQGWEFKIIVENMKNIKSTISFVVTLGCARVLLELIFGW